MVARRQGSVMIRLVRLALSVRMFRTAKWLSVTGERMLRQVEARQ